MGIKSRKVFGDEDPKGILEDYTGQEWGVRWGELGRRPKQ